MEALHETLKKVLHVFASKPRNFQQILDHSFF
jgi:hypothetical protein